MKRHRSLHGLLLCTLLVFAVNCGDDETTGPENSLVGTWDFIGFSDDGVEAETTGTWIFRANGTGSFDGTVQFPGEGIEIVSGDFSYQQGDSSVDLIIDQEASTWTIEFTGDVVVLTYTENTGTTITLRRR